MTARRSAAAVDVGSSGAVTVSADTGGAPLPLTLTVCQTDPTARCLNTPISSVAAQLDANAAATFSVFARASGTVAFNPATYRIFLRFRDANGQTRGVTSVAVRTQ